MSAARLFAATTLADAASAHAALLPAGDDTTAEVQYVLDAWDDQQAVANVLMYPDVIAGPLRVPTLVRGLEDEGYLQVAAAVGAGRLPAAIAEEDRVALVDALLDLVAGQGGLAAVHAADALGRLAQDGDAAEIVVLLGHPDDDVRVRLQTATIDLLGAAGLDRLLDDRDLVQPDDAELARDQLADDGVDLAAGGVVGPPAPAPLPSLADYDGT
jgi:hypothetical protein